MTNYIEGGSVSICDREREDDEDGSVTLCDQTPEGDGTVVFCGEQPEPEQIPPADPCDGLDTLIISGPGDPDEDSSYSVSGGRAPYTFSISAGTISDNGGIISLLGACGTGTVTVTDSCGNTAQMEVRFPDGQWVLASSTPGPCGEVGNLSCNPGTVNCSPTISGGTKTQYIVASGDWRACIGGLDCSACVWTHHIDEIECGGQTVPKPIPSACGSNATIWVLSRTDVYSWSCP